MRNRREALIAIDVQNDFCPGGALAVPDGDGIVPSVNSLMADFATVVLTQDWHPANHSCFASRHKGSQPFGTTEMSYGRQVLWPDHCIEGTYGAAFHDGLETARADLVIRKGRNPDIDSYSAFFENDRRTPTGLEGFLRTRGIDTLTFVGLATDFCVCHSAVDAARLGFTASVTLDLCRAIDLDGSLSAARKCMAAVGVEVR